MQKKLKKCKMQVETVRAPRYLVTFEH